MHIPFNVCNEIVNFGMSCLLGDTCGVSIYLNSHNNNKYRELGKSEFCFSFELDWNSATRLLKFGQDCGEKSVRIATTANTFFFAKFYIF